MMDFKLIVISPENDVEKEGQWLTRMFEEGLKLFHLRKPGYSETQMKQYIQLLPEKYRSKIVLHSHFHLAGELNLKGIHLSEKEKIEFRTKGKTINSISASFHSIKELQRSRRKYAYVFLSPVYDSISKKGYAAGFNREELNVFLSKTNQQVIALGGINKQRITELKKMGFKGAAVLGYIWEATNPLSKWRELKSEI